VGATSLIRPAGTLWKKHAFTFSSDRGGAQILVTDVNGDGRADVITAMNAHGFGLSWFEQTRNADGAISFTEHKMMGTRAEEKTYGVAFSQPHALTLADLDGDNLPDVITGKRRWAHGPTGDIEPMATPVNYAFLLRRDPHRAGGARCVPQLIDDASGLGTQVEAIDVNRDGTPDVLTASKLGSFLFLTEAAMTPQISPPSSSSGARLLATTVAAHGALICFGTHSAARPTRAHARRSSHRAHHAAGRARQQLRLRPARRHQLLLRPRPRRPELRVDGRLHRPSPTSAQSTNSSRPPPSSERSSIARPAPPRSVRRRSDPRAQNRLQGLHAPASLRRTPLHR